MKISIEEIDKNKQEEIIIKCHKLDDEVLQILKQLQTNNDVLIGYDGEIIHRIRRENIFYFEAVDNKVFVYCKEKVFESKQKLYELEEIFEFRNFFRASKSTIVNISKISSVQPSLSGRFEATLDNGEKVIISRQYVSVLKKRLGL
ncbi:LytTR family DNA-binding domain-containing protein [Clostridium estertheticum]|uniref:LytTR family DNA-binding domain-containing protein n=1 Tax=Clostridium estertheticum TaxID=238834 RepID=UPI001C7CD44A|nr:LytTR family DNA-binding domain-containing protein [Clostridium estertheticum]MBX4271616.1 LytTR family transcriptional regulator [Clostridium estertheticum]WLC82115.1 LytTR family transcriptional regulator [Clostridium estertheticum]